MQEISYHKKHLHIFISRVYYSKLNPIWADGRTPSWAGTKRAKMGNKNMCMMFCNSCTLKISCDFHKSGSSHLAYWLAGHVVAKSLNSETEKSFVFF